MLGAVVAIWTLRNSDVFPVPGADYFTSVLYPIVVDEAFQVSTAVPTNGYQFEWEEELLTVSNPTITTGSLIPSIVYQQYNNWPNETFGVETPTITTGSLIPSIVYQQYNNWPNETFGVETPVILGGDIQVTIVYIDYNNWPNETFGVETPQIVNGALT